MKTALSYSRATVATFLLSSLLAGCGRDSTRANSGQLPDIAESAASSNTRVAVASINPTQGNQVRGTVRFVEETGGVRVIADITGLTPGHGCPVNDLSCFCKLQ